MRLWIILIFTLLLCLLPKPIYSQWQKHSNNPVISSSSQGCDAIHASSPSVIYDGNQYQMWYQGYNGLVWNICYATSIDGLVWNKHSDPVITTTNYSELSISEVTEPSVRKAGETYQIWFKDRSNSKNRIRYGTSVDGINWQVHPTPILEGRNNSWDSDGPTNPYIFSDSKTGYYYLWYAANNGAGGSWKIGFAKSDNGINWIKYDNNPLNLITPENYGFVGGMSVMEIGDKYYLWYHVGSSGQNIGIYQTTSNSIINQDWQCGQVCQIISRTDLSFDQSGIVAPDVVMVDNQLYMYYGGFSNNKWQIGLATYDIPITITPTSIPSPTNIPLPTPTISLPTPTPTIIPEKTITIIIPGMFASWNREAILHNKQTINNDWKIPSYITEYEGIKKTLENLGHQEKQNFFIFPYDWRKKIDKTSDDLNDFINNISANNQQTKINIIGHSLGGLIGRIWMQKYNSDKLNKIVTIGTPHQGTAQVYKAVEAGKIDKQNNALWLAEKIILTLNKSLFESDKTTLEKVMPVLKDIFPTYPFLKNNNSYLPVESLRIKNETLLEYNLNLPDYYNKLFTLAGNIGQTLQGYQIETMGKSDYPDGKPVSAIKSVGDYLITEESSSVGNNKNILTLNHGELIYRTDAIKKILQILEISFSNQSIIEGKATIIEPSLIFFVKSPVKLKVFINNKIYQEEDGIVFIPNAPNGNYKIELLGIDNGQFVLYTGQIGLYKDYWTENQGSTIKGQKLIYTLDFDNKNPGKKIKKHKKINWFHHIFNFFSKNND